MPFPEGRRGESSDLLPDPVNENGADRQQDQHGNDLQQVDMMKEIGAKCLNPAGSGIFILFQIVIFRN